jgi:chromate reductase, NAD(P)H dehydrogenase (quinone)
MHVLAISGSLRRDSHNTALLRAAKGLAPSGVEVELWNGLREIPPFCEDDEHAPPAAVEDLRRRIANADAVLISTPEYNATVPGQLKNALDWASRPFETNVFRGKPVAVMSASIGAYGAIWAQADVRKALGFMGARVLEGDVALSHADRQFDSDGRLVSQQNQEQVAQLMADLAVAVEPRSHVPAVAAA